MITASEPLEFIPRGRQAVEQHTGPITARQVPPAEFLLLQRMQDVNLSLDEEKSVDEFYTLRALPIGSSSQRNETPSGKRYGLQAIAPFHCTEEELYVRGSTAVWTRNAGGSGIASTGLLQTALTCDNAIKFAFFAPARFLVPDTESPAGNPGDPGTPRTGICLVDRDVLQVYCDTGETYAAKVECPIAAVWLIPCGILFEKDPSRSVLETETIPMPRLFTLTYPTDDMRPVLLQHASSTSYLTEPQYRVVFTCEQLELVLLYDKQRDTHFVCRLRPASECPPPSECPLQGFGNYSAGQKSSVGGGTSAGGQYITPSTSMYKSSLLARHHNASTTQRSLASSRVHGTDLGGSGGIARDSRDASLDASTSSMVGGGGRASSSLAMSQLSFLQSMLCEEVNDSHDHRRFGVAEPSKPITAEYALKHIWTEEHTSTKGSPYGCVGEAATLGFLHTDLVDNRYLCYLRPKKMCLTLLQYEPATSVISRSHKISARAAVAIERLNMIVVIAPSGKLMLYSGPSSVGKLHMTGPLTGCFLTSTTTTAGTTTTTASATNAPLFHPPPAPGAPPTVSSFGALPRRSSLLPNATAHVDSKFEEELHLLSPVRPLGATTSSTVASSFGSTFPHCTTLRDAIDDRFTLVFDNERLYRVTLPPVTESQLIRRALIVLRHVLPDSIALEFFIRWYGARNAPGSQEFSTHQEWEQFRGLLFIMLGRPPSPGSLCPSSPGEEPKKRRKDESHHGTGSDWEFLLHHATYRRITKPTPKAYEGTSPRAYQQHDQRPLYPHLAELWQALHLLYEDFRLDKGFRDEQHLLGEFLYSLASDAQISAFQEHYINDFPSLAVCQLHSHGYRITDPTVLARLAAGSRGEPEGTVIPHVLRYAEDLVYRGINPDEQLDIFPCLPGINDLTRDMLLLIALIYRVRSLTPWIKQQLESLAIPIGDWTATTDANENDSSAAGRSLAGLTIVRIMIERGYTRDRIDHLPPAIRYVLLQCLESYRRQPQHGLTGSVYELLMRPELNAHGGRESANCLSSKTAATIDDALIQWLTDASEPDGGGAGGTGVSIGVLGGSSSSASGRDDGGGGGGGSCSGGGSKLEPDDGMDGLDGQLLALRFPDDKRIEDVRSFLDSSQRVLIDIPQAPSVSDHDFLEDQEKRLYAISLRTMALPVGRGMFTLATYRPQETQTMPIPKLCLSGKEALRGATIEIHQIEVPTNMGLWPSFHNGVAAGLRIAPSAPNLTSTWIKHNAPGGTGKSTGGTAAAAIHPEAVTEHGGFLLALGLSGHLRHLSPNSIFDYMVNGDEMVRLGLLLGLSATHRGTMDLVTTKLLSVHMEALLPPTAVELDISQNLQIATLMGVGLLYQGSARSHIAEVLLQEIGRPPGPEMENCVERESYSLTAGLALGLVTLGEGDRSTVLRDLELPDTLHYYMHGGARRQVEGAQKEKYKLPSFQIREGGTVNIDVTAPGATLALGLMYHRTGNEAIAGWLQPPATNYELSYVRPDLLLLRGIARHLILWDSIEPTPAWVQQHVPPVLDQTVANVERYHEAYRAGEGSGAPPDLGPGATGQPDWLNLPLSKSEGEIYCQAYCNILSSGAIAIGLRYAGTADPTATDTLYDYLSYFITVRQQAPVGKLAGSQAVENCTMMVLLSLSLVLAGTGDLRVLRVIRMLRARVGRCYVTYGSFMAIHMALGFLFLGGGRYTLSRSPAAIAALVCALFPKFPTYSNDNRYHLQAFRHLYVLALEPRLLVPRSISDAGLCLCRIEYVTRDQPNECTRVMAPCMLPELATLVKVCIIDDSYWHICFHKPNWHLLEKILRSCGYVEVQQRVGRLSRIEDPSRQRTLRLQTLTSGRRTPWKFDPQQLLEFDSQPMVLSLVRKLLLLDHYSAPNEQLGPDRLTAAAVDGNTLQLLVPLVSECVMHDRIHALSIFMDLSKILIEFKRNANTADAWQVRLFMAIIHNQLPLQDPIADRLLNDDILRSLINRIWMECERELPRHAYQMKRYLGFGVSGQQTRQTIAEHLCELVPVSESCSSNLIAANERRETELAALLRLIVLYDLPHDLLRNFVSNVFPGGSPLADELRFRLDIQTKLPTRSIDLIVRLFDTGFEAAS